MIKIELTEEEFSILKISFYEMDDKNWICDEQGMSKAFNSLQDKIEQEHNNIDNGTANNRKSL